MKTRAASIFHVRLYCNVAEKGNGWCWDMLEQLALEEQAAVDCTCRKIFTSKRCPEARGHFDELCSGGSTIFTKDTTKFTPKQGDFLLLGDIGRCFKILMVNPLCQFSSSMINLLWIYLSISPAPCVQMGFKWYSKFNVELFSYKSSALCSDGF